MRHDLTSENRARTGGEDDGRDRCTDVIHIDEEDDINNTLCSQCEEESREYEVNELWGTRKRVFGEKNLMTDVAVFAWNFLAEM